MKSVILLRFLSLFTYFSPLTTIFLVLLGVYFVTYKLRRWRLETLLDKIPGPKPMPFIGNMLEIVTGYEGWYCFCFFFFEF